MDLLNLNTFTETNSSIYLIDENLCLKDSVEILNHNFANWQKQINEIDSKLSLVQDSIPFVLEQAEEWANFLNLLDSLESSLTTSFDVVDSIENWNVDISFTYPVILPLEEWGVATDVASIPRKLFFYQNAISWLNTSLDKTKFRINQIIRLNFIFQITKDFRVHYSADYLENCIATPLNTISCSNGPSLYVGCNHYGGLAGESPSCTNAYEPSGPQSHYCTSEYIAVSPANNCWATDPFTLTTEYSYYDTETITSKLVTVRFILKQNSWELYSENVNESNA